MDSQITFPPKARSKKLVGIFRECSTYSFMGCYNCISDNRQNQG